MVILRVILGVILTVVYVIVMMEIVLGDDSYDKSCNPRGDPGRDLIFWKFNEVYKLCSILSHWKCLPL